MNWIEEKKGIKTFDIGKFSDDLNNVLERAEMLAEWFFGEECSYIEDHINSHAPLPDSDGGSWCICGGVEDEKGICSNEDCVKRVAKTLISDKLQEELKNES